MRRAFITALWALMACWPLLAQIPGPLSAQVIPAGARIRLALPSVPTTAPTLLTLADPPRLAVDLSLAASLKTDTPGVPPVRQARVARFDPRTLRLVLDLDRPAKVVGARWAPGPTLEIDLAETRDDEFRRAAGMGRRPLPLMSSDPLASVEAVLAGTRAAASPDPPARVPAERLRRATARPVVVLDAGHGGHDPGAIGVDGTLEKDVALAIARVAARQLERGRKVDVRLTRTDDRFLSLAERVALARRWEAALFVSIHADSAPNPEARGATVYTLSETASDREAERLAARENLADALPGRDLSQEPVEAQVVLVDLALRDSMNRSAAFAQLLQRRMEPEGVVFHGRFHRFAGFRVLRNLGVPAVLLEAGYLSNAEDARFLASDEGRERIARGLARAIEEWLAGP
ncbi:MAG: N-acetylmuramoyl-L-alanine amidase [Sphingomonadaceae bacterium]|uniref:N-acetylmuramoyl-L-alanine amidase n=1 Tax=Thermaurantiacus sp. TaxID=2820283 RepID=UPI00298EF223|nr:N-acetylmuramoyl-L-alanine amidase [Thermaurantiacus sp.]MCS6986999.1 N-acetylmuramoyl-L-alanine amidase [Sphingomonadaceae bacterium]MDW8415663.1 N-acetylmuramoyl-L-alanine amidase [Thermaurantiacus sp.]